VERGSSPIAPSIRHSLLGGKAGAQQGLRTGKKTSRKALKDLTQGEVIHINLPGGGYEIRWRDRRFYGM
jgi:hypothetical protein